MEKHEYITLFEKHLAGNATIEERQILKDYIDEFELLDLPWDSITMGDQAEVRARLYNSLQAYINPVSAKHIVLKFWYAAAAILLIGSMSLYFGVFLKSDKKPAQQIAQTNFQVISPGGNKAVLTLSDGSRVTLDDKGAKRVFQQDGAIITNTQGGVLVYNGANTNNAQTNTFNTISIPRGGKYDVILSDGTKVWLNASSTLRFPTTFSGNERKVFVTGEAYFEVARNASMPFKVEANGTTVRVLGTHFNVMAYEDEITTKTTLIEGSVEVANKSSKRMLKPGHQATIDHSTGFISVDRVNAAQFIAWKEGKFVFDDDGIEIIMRRLSRWYDVDVSYSMGNLSEKTFTGTISRYENINEVLHMLELTGTIHFKVAGRRITVMP